MEFRFGLKQRIYNWGLRAARERLNLRQDDLGKIIGVSGGTISQIETLRHYPKDEIAEKLCNFLGYSREVLFPAWLSEFRLQCVLPAALDKSISVAEAIKLGFVSQARLITGPEETEEEIDKGFLAAELKVVLRQALTDRERRMIVLRFGLEDGKARTLEEVGGYLNVNRERVRQIEAKALRKLRHPSCSRKLKDYLE